MDYFRFSLLLRLFFLEMVLLRLLNLLPPVKLSSGLKIEFSGKWKDCFSSFNLSNIFIFMSPFRGAVGCLFMPSSCFKPPSNGWFVLNSATSSVWQFMSFSSVGCSTILENLVSAGETSAIPGSSISTSPDAGYFYEFIILKSNLIVYICKSINKTILLI